MLSKRLYLACIVGFPGLPGLEDYEEKLSVMAFIHLHAVRPNRVRVVGFGGDADI